MLWLYRSAFLYGCVRVRARVFTETLPHTHVNTRSFSMWASEYMCVAANQQIMFIGWMDVERRWGLKIGVCQIRLGDFKWARLSLNWNTHTQTEIHTHTTHMGWPHMISERMEMCPFWVTNKCEMESLNSAHCLSIIGLFFKCIAEKI